MTAIKPFIFDTKGDNFEIVGEIVRESYPNWLINKLIIRRNMFTRTIQIGSNNIRLVSKLFKILCLRSVL